MRFVNRHGPSAPRGTWQAFENLKTASPATRAERRSTCVQDEEGRFRNFEWMYSFKLYEPVTPDSTTSL